jgi:hypothetical protein
MTFLVRSLQPAVCLAALLPVARSVGKLSFSSSSVLIFVFGAIPARPAAWVH